MLGLSTHHPLSHHEIIGLCFRKSRDDGKAGAAFDEMTHEVMSGFYQISDIHSRHTDAATSHMQHGLPRDCNPHCPAGVLADPGQHLNEGPKAMTDGQPSGAAMQDHFTSLSSQ